MNKYAILALLGIIAVSNVSAVRLYEAPAAKPEAEKSTAEVAKEGEAKEATAAAVVAEEAEVKKEKAAKAGKTKKELKKEEEAKAEKQEAETNEAIAKLEKKEKAERKAKRAEKAKLEAQAEAEAAKKEWKIAKNKDGITDEHWTSIMPEHLVNKPHGPLKWAYAQAPNATAAAKQ